MGKNCELGYLAVARSISGSGIRWDPNVVLVLTVLAKLQYDIKLI
jgi:hypothetical protein